MTNAPHATLTDIERLASELTAIAAVARELLDEPDQPGNIETAKRFLVIIENGARSMLHAATTRTATYPVPA